MKEKFRLYISRFSKVDTWLYCSALLFYGYAMMQILGNPGWLSYAYLTGILSLIFLPVIIYSLFEQRIKHKFNLPVQIGTWLLCFIGLPILLLPFAKLFFVPDLINFPASGASLFDSFARDNIPTLVILYLVIRLSKKGTGENGVLQRFRRINMVALLSISVLIFSMFIPFLTNSFQNMMSELGVVDLIGKYGFYVFQIFIIIASYFIYYYINHQILFKWFFQDKGILAYLISCIGAILVIAPFHNAFLLLFPVISELSFHPLGTGIGVFDDLSYLFPIISMLVSFPVIVLIEWNRKTLALQQLSQEKTKAELLLLKQQINPHFFFNTLNNLYALSLEKSDLAPEAILKLSKLMRFVIYKGEQEYVYLKEEVEYLQDYIDLQKLRINAPVEIKMEVEIDNEQQLIPPLLLINLLENAFKHGIATSEKEGFIHINLHSLSGTINFSVENSLDKEKVSESKNGIGLTNLRRRLEIRYPNRYELQSHEGETYLATLRITE